jgi:hypothetical protein
VGGPTSIGANAVVSVEVRRSGRPAELVDMMRASGDRFVTADEARHRGELVGARRHAPRRSGAPGAAWAIPPTAHLEPKVVQPIYVPIR